MVGGLLELTSITVDFKEDNENLFKLLVQICLFFPHNVCAATCGEGLTIDCNLTLCTLFNERGVYEKRDPTNSVDGKGLFKWEDLARNPVHVHSQEPKQMNAGILAALTGLVRLSLIYPELWSSPTFSPTCLVDPGNKFQLYFKGLNESVFWNQKKLILYTSRNANAGIFVLV